MAYSRNPKLDTYSTIRIPIIQSERAEPIPTNPVNNQDGMMLNVVPFGVINEAANKTHEVRTRLGLMSLTTPNGAGVTDPARGLYVWEKTATEIYYFMVIGKVVFTSASITGPFIGVTTFTNLTTGIVRFTEFISSTSVKSLIAVDGIEGWVFTTNAAGTKIVDVDFPTPHIPFPVFLNGRLHLAKAATGDIYCSDLDNPAAWTAGSFISSEVYPDDIQALVKIDNYIFAIGLIGSEYFYDAGNSPGSPLARVENANFPFGTSYPNTVIGTGNTCTFIAKSTDGNIVLRNVEGFQQKQIECPQLSQILLDTTSRTDILFPLAHCFRDSGDLFYTIAIDYTTNLNAAGNISPVFVYSFSANMWVQFTRGNEANSTTYGPLAHKTYPVYFSYAGQGGFQTVVAGNAFNAPFIGRLQEENRGVDLYPLNSTNNSQVNYISTVTLPNLNFGTLNRKWMYKLGIDYVNDNERAGFSDVYIPRVTWWDWNGGEAAALPVSLVTGNYTDATHVPYPYINQLGTFRQRWIKIECYGSLVYRYIDVDINKGT